MYDPDGFIDATLEVAPSARLQIPCQILRSLGLQNIVRLSLDSGDLKFGRIGVRWV